MSELASVLSGDRLTIARPGARALGWDGDDEDEEVFDDEDVDLDEDDEEDLEEEEFFDDEDEDFDDEEDVEGGEGLDDDDL